MSEPEPITLINAFTMPAAESTRFLEHWRRSAAIMAAQPGFVRARMYQATGDGAPAFVNVAEWASETDLDHARANPEWQATIRDLLTDPELHVTARPMVYRVAVDLRPGDQP
jgi:heme-degrading monooxygenase HmoA